MNSKTLQNLRYFEGKVCSIFTHAIPREFDELRSREHFVVRIAEVGTDGIWGQHPMNGTKSFFFTPSIQFIQEEVEIDPNNPEHAAMIEEYEKKSGKKLKSDLLSPEIAKDVPDTTAKPTLEVLNQSDIDYGDVEASENESVFVDIDSLAKLADQTKAEFEAYKSRPKPF